MSSATVLPTASGRSVWRTMLAVARPHRLHLVLGTGLRLLGRGAALVAPAMIGVIVDRILDGGDPSLAGPIVVLAACAVGGALLDAAGQIVQARAGETMLADLREEVFDRALAVPIDQVERGGTGDLVARLANDVHAVSEAVRSSVPATFGSGLTIVLTLVGLAVIDWRLALVGLVGAPFNAMTLRWYLRTSGPMYAEARRVGGEQVQQVMASVLGVRTVRGFRLDGAHVDLVDARSRRNVELASTIVRTQTRFFGRLNMTELLTMATVLVVGYVLVDHDMATVGAATAAALYFLNLFDPTNELLFSVDGFQSATASIARLVGVLELPVAEQPADDRRPTEASIELDGVSFEYRPGAAVVRNVDLRIEPGQRVAVVGASGAGKTTLAKLIAGVHAPTIGQVRVGGVPLEALRAETVRSRLALVTQEVHVFAGRLGDDVRLVRPDASEAEVMDAVTVAGAAGWIGELPDGLATEVGAGGATLDAAQSQQLALARVVLADRPIVILDEATAEAGSAGARVLDAATDRVVAGRTSLIVAHRLTQAVAADRVLVMVDGAIVEDGAHSDLLAADGEYARLWSAWAGSRT